MEPIVKWKDGKYSRILLPHEINFDTIFQQHNNKMFGISDTDDHATHFLKDYDDIYRFLDSHSEYLFDGDTVGKLLWNDIGTSYLINDTKYVVNIPSIEFPNLNNYVEQRLGPLTRKECSTVYTKAFFSDRRRVTLTELKQILGVKNG